MRAVAWNFLLAFLLAHFMCSYAFVPPTMLGVGKLTRGSARRTGPSKIFCQGLSNAAILSKCFLNIHAKGPCEPICHDWDVPQPNYKSIG